MYISHEWKIPATNCFSVVILASSKIDELDLMDRFLGKFPELKKVKITDIIPFSECYNYLKSSSFYHSGKPDRFNGKLPYVKRPSFETILDVKKRCVIPLNPCKTTYDHDRRNYVACMADYVRSYVKCVTLCCCEGPPSIFCIKYCKEKYLSCCQLCKVETEKFDTYSDFETETDSEESGEGSRTGSDEDTSSTSDSD